VVQAVATSRKVTSSIPDCVIGIFRRHNTSGRTVALGSTQPLTEMSTKNISWGVNKLHVPNVLKSESVNILEPQGPVQAGNGIVLSMSFTFF
jgi:hypothetical protein